MRLPGWKKAQKKQKEKKRSLLMKRIFLLIGLILLLGIGYQAWGSFRGSLWDGQNRITLALNADPVLVVSFNPLNKTLVALSLPSKTYIEAIGGYGFYKAESLWELGELDNWQGELLAGSLQGYLGAPVEAYAQWTDFQWQEAQPRESCQSLIGNLLIGRGITNLTKWDLIRLWWGVGQVRFDKVSLVKLEETEAVTEITLPDRTRALESNPLYLDRLVSQLLLDQKIRKEDFSIGVYNATGHSGLAKKAARLINNFGGQVIEVGDWDSEKETCEIRSIKEERGSYTVKKLSQIFDCRLSDEAVGEQVEVGLILGEDYRQHLLGK